MRGVVPATSPIVNWPFLRILSQGPTLVPVTSPKNSNQFEFLGQVPATCFGAVLQPRSTANKV